METKKVIEQETVKGIEVHKLECLTVVYQFGKAPIDIEESKATEVAKAIDPEYQKVIDELEFLRAEHPVNIAIRNENKNLKDQNAKLVEALSKVKDILESPKLIDGRVLRYIVNEALQNTKNIEG